MPLSDLKRYHIDLQRPLMDVIKISYGPKTACYGPDMDLKRTNMDINRPLIDLKRPQMDLKGLLCFCIM